MLDAEKKAKTRKKIDDVMNSKVETTKSDAVVATDYKKFIPQIQKRDGRITPFIFDNVAKAIYKAMTASSEGSMDEATMVAHQVAADMLRIARKYRNFMPTVEGCQDEVERQLILSDYVVTAKSYTVLPYPPK